MTGPDEHSSREALIAAMARCCAEHGYEETTVEQLVAAAGCSESGFYRHFADKEECALAAVETILSEGIARVAAGYSADTSEWESALNALAQLLELFSALPAFARLAFIDSRQAMPPAASDRYKEGFAILAAMLDRLREGEGVPAVAARAAAGGGEALVRRELVVGGGTELPAILPDLVYIATVPFLGQKEALRLSRRAGGLVGTP